MSQVISRRSQDVQGSKICNAGVITLVRKCIPHMGARYQIRQAPSTFQRCNRLDTSVSQSQAHFFAVLTVDPLFTFPGTLSFLYFFFLRCSFSLPLRRSFSHSVFTSFAPLLLINEITFIHFHLLIHTLIGSLF